MHCTHYKQRRVGFSLIELLVVISIIGIIATFAYVSFGEARAQSRDDIRKSDVRQLQLAIELYRAQNGEYPDAGCSASAGDWVASSDFSPVPADIDIDNCTNYIDGLVPDYIGELPTEVSANPQNKGYVYRSDGTDYKIMTYHSVESKTIITTDTDGGFGQPFARYSDSNCVPGAFPASEIDVYAAFSDGAKCW